MADGFDLNAVSSGAAANASGVMPGFGGATGLEDESADRVLDLVGLGSGYSHSHNEAIYDWLRSEASAATARNWDKYMQDTQMQRKLRDYAAAGFSPLAALEGSGNYGQTSAVGQSHAATGGRSGKGLVDVLKAVMDAVVGIKKAAMMQQTAQAVNQQRTETQLDIANLRSETALAAANSKNAAILQKAYIDRDIDEHWYRDSNGELHRERGASRVR